MESPFYRIDPLRLYEVKGSGGLQVCPIQTKAFTSIIGLGQVIIPAISGQIIRVMGLLAQGVTGVTAGTFNLRSNSTGSIIYPTFTAPLATAQPGGLPFLDAGYFQTNLGEGLYTDVTAATLSMGVFYITYAP